MSGKVKVGVFGARRGMSMINVLSKYELAQLVAVCDRDEKQLQACKKLADEAGIEVALYQDFDRFFEHDMDAVVLANYATEHAPYAIRLLKSGRHVMSEVLPVQTLSQAVALVEAVEESGKIYSYAENYCFMNRTFEMKTRYRRGDIGELMHAEGEYVHDSSNIWPQITYGDKNHWRNRLFSCFYCTHSLGPVLNITGLRPVRIVGFENQPLNTLVAYGKRCAATGLIVAQLENGATIKTMNSTVKRQPPVNYYTIFGQKGSMETDRWSDDLHVYIEDGVNAKGKSESYVPEFLVNSDLSKSISGHGGSDFYTVYFFIEKILGREDGEHSIGIYPALDMGIAGILAYRSILNGNKPIEFPDFRDKAIREQYRNDNACTDPAVAGDQLLPCYSRGEIEVDDSVYDKVRDMWEKGISG